MISQRFD